MEKRGLGKGLGALLSNTLAEDDAGSVRDIRLDHIRPNPYQPRHTTDEAKIIELAESIRENGILQPVLVRRVGVDVYELIAGHRRAYAAQELGLFTIPAIIKRCSDQEMLEIALVENLQREDINAVDAALAYKRLAEEFGLTQEEIARRVGKAQPTIANTLRLLSLPEPILESLRRGVISESHARALLQAPSEVQLRVWEDVCKRGLSAKETERLTRAWRKGAVEPSLPQPSGEQEMPRDPNLAAVEEALQIALSTKVRIRQSGSIGKLEIEFYSLEELEGIVERIIGTGDGR